MTKNRFSGSDLRARKGSSSGISKKRFPSKLTEERVFGGITK